MYIIYYVYYIYTVYTVSLSIYINLYGIHIAYVCGNAWNSPSYNQPNVPPSGLGRKGSTDRGEFLAALPGPGLVPWVGQRSPLNSRVYKPN